MCKQFDRWNSLRDSSSQVSDCIRLLDRLCLDSDIGIATCCYAVSSLRTVLKELQYEMADCSSALAHYDKCQSCSMCQED